MSIERLQAILPPPTEPIACGDANAWARIELQIGVKLPDDYKQFTHKYGAGQIDEFIWAYNPFVDNPDLNLLIGGNNDLNALRRFRSDYGMQLPFPIFPEMNGVFPWGVTANGDSLYWRVHGRTCFAVVALESRAAGWQEFNTSMTGFLTDVLSRRIVVEFFPDDVVHREHQFVPVT